MCTHMFDVVLCCSTVLSVTLSLLLYGHLCCEVVFVQKDLVRSWDAVLVDSYCPC